MKKPKKKTIFVILNKKFSTFKEFKTFAWYNMKPGEVTKGFEIFEDTIIKEYNLNRKERRLIIEKYLTYVKSRSERERQAEVKQVTGCFTGAYAVNPFNKKEIPIYIAEYVLAGYGTAL